MFVLRTNAYLPPLEAMLVYKQLWMVERAFRTSKNLFETRPIFHKLDQTIRGHVAMQDRLAAGDLSARASWPAVLADLNSLTETEIEQQQALPPPFRSRPAASLALQTVGVASPPTLRQIAGA